MARDWIKWYGSVYADESTVGILAEDVEDGALVYALWPAICMKAAQAKIPGQFPTSVRAMRRMIRSTASMVKHRAVWEAMLMTDLVNVEGDIDAEFVLTVNKFTERQWMSNADWQAVKNGKSKALQIVQDSSVTDCQSLSSLSRGDGDEEEEKRNNSPTVSVASEDPKTLPLSKRRRVKGVSDDELEKRIAGCRSLLGDAAAAVEQYVELAAGSRKAGSIALSTAYAAFWEPLARFVIQQDEGDRGRARMAVQAGVSAAAAKQITKDARYALVVAEGWRPGEVSKIPQLGTGLSADDRLAQAGY